eukprot:TRINITY_DN43161_c0_g1_i1.p1 TRINITY_DN43161_c0_g1~~TRINITY_DN43161_c0_g1_i1.p1  ORF type:complete len:227 (-),score=9.18 TRINITY_DN43161_c0_g1_i1:60-692(-)
MSLAGLRQPCGTLKWSDSEKQGLSDSLGMVKPQGTLYKIFNKHLNNMTVTQLIVQRNLRHFKLSEFARSHIDLEKVGRYIESGSRKHAFESFQVLRWLTNANVSEGRFQKNSACPICQSVSDRIEHLIRCQGISRLLCERFPEFDGIFGGVWGWAAELLIVLSFGHCDKRTVRSAMKCFCHAALVVHSCEHEHPTSWDQVAKISKAVALL